jgi:uncharacterized protein (TIGR00369 family)
MIKILNPFTGKEGAEFYNCFGCSPDNETGLHMEFWLDGEELIAKWKPRKSFEGWAGVLHGGIQAALLDEAAAWLVFAHLKTAGVTARLNVNYTKPVYISKGEIIVRAWLVSKAQRIAQIACTLEDGHGEVCASAEASYFCFPENVARAKYNYPGAEAFFEQQQKI